MPRYAQRLVPVSAYAEPEWRDWVDELAAFARLNRSVLIDQSLTAFGAAIGFPKPAPPRLTGPAEKETITT